MFAELNDVRTSKRILGKLKIFKLEQGQGRFTMDTRNYTFFLSIVWIALWHTKNFLDISFTKGRNNLSLELLLSKFSKRN